MSDEKKVIDILGIQEILPHRYPFLLVDRVIDVEPFVRATGIKNVTMNEEFFQGHFPGQPVMPGVLMIEAMAQVSGVCVLCEGEGRGKKIVLFMSVNNVKFRRMVTPGDQLVMEVEVLRNKPRAIQTRGVAKVDGEVVCEAEMMFSCVDRK